MVKELLIDSEKKEIRKMFRQISDAFLLTSPGCAQIENLISIRYLLRKNVFTPYCKIIQSVPEGASRCKECDKLLVKAVLKKKEPVYHVCHAGLVDFCFPLAHKGNIIPIIGGQLLFLALTPEREKEIIRKISPLNLCSGELEKALRSVPVIPLQTVKTLISLLTGFLENFSALEITDMLNKLSGSGSLRNEKLHSITEFIRANYRERYSLVEIADKLSISPYYIEHLFKKEFGISVIAYRNHLRLLAAKELLKGTPAPITQIAFDLGWNDSNYFSNCFKKETGFSPSAYRRAPNKDNIL